VIGAFEGFKKAAVDENNGSYEKSSASLFETTITFRFPGKHAYIAVFVLWMLFPVSSMAAAQVKSV